MRGLPKLPLTDWPMVIPSIFRAGTCFMGFRAWNSSENCGHEALVDWNPSAYCPPAPPPLGKALAPNPRVTPGGLRVEPRSTVAAETQALS